MMKKLILFCLALAMVATAVPAMAATNVNFKGFVKVYHDNTYNFTRKTVDENWKDSDSFFSNRLQLDLELQPNEDVSIYWRIRSVHNVRWGVASTLSGAGYRAATALYTQYVYAEIRQPWGTVQIGRLADGLGSSAWGLASLGYAPTWGVEYLYANPFDTGNSTDSIVYSYDFGNGFSLAAFYAKDASADNGRVVFAGPPTITKYYKDQDADRFGVEAKYTWDTGGASLAIMYARDMTGYDISTALHPYAVSKNWAIFINPAFVQSWGPFSIHFESQIAWGKSTWRDVCRELGTPCSLTDVEPNFHAKDKGFGVYLDASYNYGAGDVTLMGLYVDGNNWNFDRDEGHTGHNLVSVGDFGPFLVAFHANAVGRGYYTDFSIGGDDVFGENNLGYWGLFGVGLLGNHAINDDIKLNWGLGYFRTAHQAYENASKSVGFEIDLGATFQILENVSFETQFGYMFNGSVFKDTTTGKKPGGSFAWANVLAVTF